MEELRKLGTKEKALRINLDPSIYGTFAEIGAGQEVAANFFQAGGASGTIASCTSAYDMKISDSLYGESDRYVDEPRLLTMLDKEYESLVQKLSHRSDSSRFFVFADTVEALNYFKTNRGHGWLGVRFQLEPNQPPCEVVIHVVMHDNDTLMQHRAIGRLGVNLIYGCYFYSDDPERLMTSLVDNLTHRIEIDMIRLTGPAFEKVDNRLMSLLLVKNGLTDAAMFGPDGNVLQASNAVYKKNILVLRGRFRPVTHVNMDMLIQGLEQFRKESDVNPDTTAVIFELTLKDLSAEGQIDEKDFLDRVDILCSMGHMVMISNYLKYYKLVSYLSDSVRNRKVGVILGIDNLRQIFDAQYYDTLKGGMLEALGILFGRNVKLFVYPSLNRETGALNTFNDMDFGDDLDYILNYLRSTDRIAGIKSSNRDILHIYSDTVLSMIKSGQAGWDTMVPSKVAEMIRNNCLFDCKEEAGTNGQDGSLSASTAEEEQVQQSR